MVTLLVNVEDALLERITDAAQERGEDTEHLIVEVLRQVFKSKAIEDTTPLDEQMLAVLAPHWAEQDRQEAGSEVSGQSGGPGDAAEEYLARYWAEDIRKGSMNR